ncbi:GATA zinc finger domain-containing protein 14 [Microplitis demolitor]|uniref:GATA zinc finger domain-containing protein 14 n=1 Tax=Microplitis demolitor TaxID=69319 RepID=UPI0004CD5E1F|nr:GATA zinc finger domain-containing protein 14 [Microplitis demolitor]
MSSNNKSNRKSRRRKPRSANDSKAKMTNMSSVIDGKKEYKNIDIYQNYPSTSNSAPHIQSHYSSNNRENYHVAMRPRSLYTTYNYHPNDNNNNFQRFNDFSKYLESPPSDQWTGINNNSNYNGANTIWRQRNPTKSLITPYYPSEDNNNCIYGENWRDHDIEGGSVGAVATPHGTISLRLHNRIRVDMTVDRAVRVINFKNNIVLSLSGSGSAAALLHPNGRIYQYGSRVEILAHDSHGNNKFAKMWYKGVSFTSEQCALVYLVDAAGTRTTTDSFSDMSQDFSLSVFYAESRHGPACLQEATTALNAAQYWVTEEGVENWIINNVRVSQTSDGLVRIARNSNKYQLRTSPSNGTASLTTPFMHCTASLGQTSHLFVRRGERRMHYDGTSFIVRNAGHSAGFDDNNQLKVY